MWDYSEKVLDHFHHPRNVGTIENPDGVGEVGALACGDALKLMFKLDKDGRIADVKFQTFGCASAIANYRTGDTTVRELKDDPLVCTCFNVHESEIVEAVRINKLTTVEQVTNYTKAGGACGRCKGAIQAILDRELGKAPAAAPAAPAEPAAPTAFADLSPAKKVLAVEKVLEAEVRPALRLDGGDVELLDVEGTTVKIRFLGHCAHCMAAQLTQDGLVEKKLREALGDDAVKVEAQA